MDLARQHTIRESHHRILNPYTPEKLTTLGAALRLRPGDIMLDLCCGKGEMLSTWAREHAITGTGVDISTVFLAAARERAAALDVAAQVSFVHGDASSYIADSPVDVAACVGATWIGGGVTGTVGLLERSLRPGGLMLIGEPFWRAEPPSQEAVEGCFAQSPQRLSGFAGPHLPLPGAELRRRRNGAGRRGQLGSLRGRAMAERQNLARRQPR